MNIEPVSDGTGLFRTFAYALERPNRNRSKHRWPSLLIPAFAAIAGFIATIVGHNLYRITSLNSYDGTQYGGPDIQPVTPNDAFHVVTKNNIDPNPIEV